MTSRILQSSDLPELQPTCELHAQAAGAARFPFTATTRAAAEAWQQACRAALAETVGFLDAPAVPAAPQVIEEVDRGDFIRRKVVIRTAEHALMPVYLLLPKDADGPRPLAGPRPVALAYAGHGYGVKDIVGLWEDGTERLTPDGYHKDFALELCRRGFVVAAPEIACFGERQTDYGYLDTNLGQPQPSTCHNAATYAFMLGKSVVGMRVRDGMRLLDYLATLPEADTGRTVAMGISGGGMLTFFHTMLDTRIRACVVSGYYSSFRDSILAMDHCTCNFVPGLLNLGEMADLVGLILPRPMLVEAGTRDPIFPIATVHASVARAREVCEVLGGSGQQDVELDEFEGRHQISGRRAYDFLWQHAQAVR
jgi:dienelactone hydrolase